MIKTHFICLVVLSLSAQAMAMGSAPAVRLAGYRLTAPCQGEWWDANYPDQRTPLPAPQLPGQPMDRSPTDPGLQEFRLDVPQGGPALLQYVLPSGALARIPLTGSKVRSLSGLTDGWAIEDRVMQSSWPLHWWEIARFEARRLPDGRLSTHWSVNQSAYQMQQSCVFESIVPAPAPVRPDASAAFDCKGRVSEMAPAELRVTLDAQPQTPIYREILSPVLADGTGGQESTRWFNPAWEQTGQGPLYGEITLLSRQASLWEQSFQLPDPRSGQAFSGLPDVSMPSIDGLTPGVSYTLELAAPQAAPAPSIAAAHLRLIAPSSEAQGSVDFDPGAPWTARGTVTVRLPSLSRSATVEGHRLDSGDSSPSVQLEVSCRKPGLRP